MNTDKKVLYTVSFSTLTVLLLALTVPTGSGRIIAAAILLPAAALAFILLKKRNLPSINQKQVLLILFAIAMLYVMLYYLSGLRFGFFRNPYSQGLKGVFAYVLPTAVVIVATEIYRYVLLAQNSKLAYPLCYVTCVLCELLAFSNLHGIHSFNNFMDLLGLTLFPALVSNSLYNYLSKRYGLYPNIVYRLIITLPFYIVPYSPAIEKSLLAFANIIIPFAVFAFVDALYEKKIRYALGKKNRFSTAILVVIVLLMTSLVMLISNQFKFGALVIATDSMTGELNRGDAAIFERYDGQKLDVGQIIIFERDDSRFVHRIVEIEHINGETRYYTKGDANDRRDSGHVTKAEIVGTVELKVAYVGYPTLWLRSLFLR